MTSREDTKTYLSKREIPQLFESLMTGLMYHKPENHVDYLRECLGRIENNKHNVNWDTFVENLNPQNPLPPISKDNSLSPRQSTVSNHDCVPQEMRKTSPLPPIAPTKQIEHEQSMCYILIIGGPGSGKASLCKQITERYDGYEHISIGDLLRHQVQLQATDDKWKAIAEIVRSGDFVQKDEVFELLKNELKACKKKETLGFIIEGYPRSVEQAEDFEKEFGKPDLVLSLNSEEFRMKYRLEKRTEAGERPDDTPETTQKRLEAYKNSTIPVLDLYKKQTSVLRGVNVDRDADEIFYDVANLFDSLFFTPREDAAPLRLTKTPEPLPPILKLKETREEVVKDAVSHLPSELSEIEPQTEEESKAEPEQKEVVEEMVTKEEANNTGNNDGQPLVADKEEAGTGEEPNEVKDEKSADQTDEVKGEGADTTVTLAEENPDLQKVKESVIIFVLGGPGCGKGTQCEKIAEKYGFIHLSAGDLLRREVESSSERGQELAKIMEAGELVPQDVILSLLKEAMVSKVTSSCGFLVDGFPRKLDQGEAFESQIGECKFALYFDVSDDTMKQRLLERAKTSGRADDNEETIGKRLVTFHEVTQPVIDYYVEKARLKKVLAEAAPDEIFMEVVKVFQECGICDVQGEVQDEEAALVEGSEEPAEVATTDELVAQETADNQLHDKRIMFVVGGPGSGKGTQCVKIAEMFGLKHLSSGDILRAEVASGSERGSQIKEMMEKGELVPQVLDLMKEAMLKEAANTNGFLLDGYPRNTEQGEEFESKISECQFVLCFEASDEVLTTRLLERGKTGDRVDDNEETIKKRLETFHSQTKPMIEHYNSKGKLKQIFAEGSIDEVFGEVSKLFSDSVPEAAPAEMAPAETAVEEVAPHKYFCVIGGPGSGKKEVAKKIAEKNNLTVISVGELLMAEAMKESADVKDAITGGQLVSTEKIIAVLKEAFMEKKDSAGFVLEGFPRMAEQSQEFIKQIGPIESVLVLDGTQEDLAQNISSRSETSGREDDSGHAAKQKLDVFFEYIPAVISQFKDAVESKPNLKQVSFKEVVEDVSIVLDIFSSFSPKDQAGDDS